MKIIVVGFGKVGATLTEQLYAEGHDVVVVDLLSKSLRRRQQFRRADSQEAPATMSNWRPGWRTPL
ncbi:MAG: NAD-binding protein [Blautia sp.]